MKEKTARRSSAEWTTLVGQQAQSGQTIATFCSHHRLAQPTFMYWRQKLNNKIAAANGFVPVAPRAAAPPKLLLRGRSGVEVEVPQGTPLDIVRQLITALSC